MSTTDNNEEPNAPPQPDLAGYPSQEALVAGYRASGEEAKKWRERAQTLEQQYQAAIDVANRRPDIPQRHRPEDRLTELGIPTDALDEMISQRLNNAFQPIVKQLNGAQEARVKMLASYGPDYSKYESDVAQFIASDPDMSARYQRMFETDQAGAMDYAYLKYGESRRRAQPAQTTGSPEQVVEASIPTSRKGGSPKGHNQEETLSQAWDQFKKTGNPETYAKARLRTVIKDDFLNQ